MVSIDDLGIGSPSRAFQRTHYWTHKVENSGDGPSRKSWNRRISTKNHPILIKLCTRLRIWNSRTARWPNWHNCILYENYQNSRWRMAAICFFGHNSGPHCTTSVKFCTGNQNSMAIGHVTNSKFRKFKMADSRHIANRKIAIHEWKIIRWNFVRKIADLELGDSHGQIWKFVKFKTADGPPF